MKGKKRCKWYLKGSVLSLTIFSGNSTIYQTIQNAKLQKKPYCLNMFESFVLEPILKNNHIT